MRATHHRDRVRSVTFTHEILKGLGAAGREMSLASLAKSLRVTPPRVLRHLSTLVELKLVVREGSEPVYRLGPELIRLAEQAQHQHEVVRIAYPHLAALNRDTGQATYLVRPAQRDGVIWLSLQSNEVPYLAMPPGMTFSLAASATGRAILAFSASRHDLQKRDATASTYAPDPMGTQQELNDRLAQVRARGYDLYGDEGGGSALYALGAPLRNHNGVAVAAIGLLGFTTNLRSRREHLLQALLETSARISRDMGNY